jgi:hypothetical protein
MRILLLTICIFPFFLFGQSEFPNIQLKNSGVVNTLNGISEPSIAIDPNNPSIMAAGSIMNAYYYSKDAGQTWKSYSMISKYGVWGDPVLLFDTTGRVYYFHLSDYSKGSWIDRIVCQSAPNVDGKFNTGTFPKPSGTKAQDKHWVALDPKNNEIFMTWTQFDAYDSREPRDSSRIMFSKSSDQGKTWSNPQRISKFAGDCQDGDYTVEGAVPAVGPNGEVYVTWAGPKGLVFQRSLDRGKTWLAEEQILHEQHGGWDLTIPGMYRANGLPILQCDLSDGPNRGNLYLNWCDQKSGYNNTDVWLSVSEDGGKSWSAPRKVNQDETKTHQFFTWMTVDQSSGYLYFVYYDRRNYTDNETDVYLSVSRDGGLSFSDYLVSTHSFVPDQEVFFGDYLNIAAVNGTIRPIWPRMDDGKTSLWIALIQEAELLKLGEK